MRILVTGAGGFIGLTLVETLLGQGDDVIALNDWPLSAVAQRHFAALPGHLETLEADVRDRSRLAQALRRSAPEAVLHGAAITLGPDAAPREAERAIAVNTLSTAILLEEAAAAGVRRFVYPSSSAVYGAAPFAGTPVDEEAPTAPLGLYGFTKLASETLVREAGHSKALETVCARITAAFGPWEHETGVRQTLSPPWQVARSVLNQRPFSLAKGGARDWTSSLDIAAALARLLKAERSAADVYNLGLGKVWTPDLLAEALARRRPVQMTLQDGMGPHSVAYNDDLSRKRAPISAARFTREFGFTFMTPDQAVDDYAAWLDRIGPDDFNAI